MSLDTKGISYGIENARADVVRRDLRAIREALHDRDADQHQYPTADRSRTVRTGGWPRPLRRTGVHGRFVFTFAMPADEDRPMRQ
ncbi:MAG TPA: hypothetical protein VGD53_10260 [Actinoallomurus sp.]